MKIDDVKKQVTHSVKDKYGTDLIDVVVGGDDISDYMPEAGFILNGGEDSLIISYPLSSYTSSVDVDGKVVLSTGDEDLHCYALNESELEFGLSVNSKLKTKWDFDVIGWESFDFYKQPDLSLEPGSVRVLIDGEWHYQALDGRTTPETLCGGYCVYHKVKRDNQYKVGKLLEIKRPKLIDALNNELLCDIDFKNGKLTVTADSAWVTASALPIFVDPTFGYSTTPASSTAVSAECWASVVAGSRYTASTGDTITKFTAYCRTYGVGDLDITAYSFSGGVPVTAADTTGGTLTVPGTPAWTDTNTVSIALSNGVDYCIALRESTDGARIYYDTGSSGDLSRDASTLGASFPTTWGETATFAYIMGLYATYTAGTSGGNSNLLLMGVG